MEDLKLRIDLIDEYIEIVADTFCNLGLKEDWGPNEYGLELEEAQDYLLNCARGPGCSEAAMAQRSATAADRAGHRKRGRKTSSPSATAIEKCVKPSIFKGLARFFYLCGTPVNRLKTPFFRQKRSRWRAVRQSSLRSITAYSPTQLQPKR